MKVEEWECCGLGVLIDSTYVNVPTCQLKRRRLKFGHTYTHMDHLRLLISSLRRVRGGRTRVPRAIGDLFRVYLQRLFLFIFSKRPKLV